MDSDPTTTLAGVLDQLRAGGAPAEPGWADRLDRVFAKHLAALRGLVRRELRGFPAAEVDDALQEVLVVAWRKLPTHDGRHFQAWLFAITTRVCANVRRKRRLPLAHPDEVLFTPSDDASAYARLRADERRELLLEAARQVLDPADQEVVVMRFDLELPLDEIARLAGLADADEVRVVLQRSKRRLVRELERLAATRGHGRSLYRTDG